MKFATLLILLTMAVCSSISVSGATFTVTNTDDSGTGSLRQAILDSNASVGVFDTITFNILPPDEVHTITPVTQLPFITDPVVIDGYTQPGSKANMLAADDNATLLIELNGASTFASHGLVINAGGSTVRGLVINRFSSSGIYMLTHGGNTVTGCFVGTDPEGTAALPNGEGIVVQSGDGNNIGGSTAAERNIISGNKGPAGVHLLSAFNLVQGNFVGTDRSGKNALGNTVAGINVGGGFAANNTIGGTTPGAGNIISGNSNQGIATFTNGVINLTVQGNFIGVDVTGTAGLGNATIGVHLGGSFDPALPALIGGSATGAGNIIGANGTRGIYIIQTNVVVQGNHIGTDLSGTVNLGNSQSGVETQVNAESLIGGEGPGEGNTIAFNGAGSPEGSNAGVLIYSGTHSILGNAIYSNVGLGIDFNNDGVTPNDAGDADTGANNLQNFPKISAVTVAGGNVTISGSLNSTPSTAFRLEFFSNSSADPSGFGEGQTFLGFVDVTTDPGGNATFNVTLPFTGSFNVVTATATDGDGNSSEFSHAFGIKLQNISTRMNVLTGENVLIGGFIITGDDPKQVIVRAIGPSLGIVGLSGVLDDPILELHEADGMVVTSDNWKDTQQAEIEATGLQPSDDLESAIVAALEPGLYTAVVSGKDSGTGVGLVEVFDLDQFLGPILANISTRGFVDMGDNVMIGGFIVGPTDTGLADVLVRAIGPSLSDFGIANPLLDPLLELHDSNGALLTTNDNWKDTQETEIEATGLPPTNDSESAILQTLAPGAYTAVVRGVADTTGVGLVEVYNLPNTL
jgi:hypothetical protein